MQQKRIILVPQQSKVLQVRHVPVRHQLTIFMTIVHMIQENIEKKINHYRTIQIAQGSQVVYNRFRIFIKRILPIRKA